MSVDFLIRIVGMLVFSVLGGYLGFWFGSTNSTPQTWTYTFGFATVGALFGLIGTPYFTTLPMRAIRRLLVRVSAENLLAGLSGLVAGLLVCLLYTSDAADE